MKTARQSGRIANPVESRSGGSCNGRPALVLREAAIFSIQLREECGGAGRDTFFVEALDIEDAARRGRAIAIYQSASERGGGVFWEVALVEAAGTVRRLFPELKQNNGRRV